MQPCDHPAVWNSEQLGSRPDWERSWSDEELFELRGLAAELLDSDLAAAGHFQPLNEGTPRLRQKMLSVREDLEQGCGATRISGFPIAQYSEQVSAALFTRLMATVGTAVPQTADGQRLFRVQDEGHPENHPKARGPSSRRRLSFHTDRCDVISFLCIRPAREGGENQLVSSMAIFNRILAERPDLLNCLLKPYAYQRHNVDPGNENAFYYQPVFSFCQGYFAANILRALIERAYATTDIGPMNNEQREALDYLEEVAEDPKMQVVFRQQPGDVVLLNNFVTLHRRNAFVDDSDQNLKRLLYRIWLAVPNSRPLDESFTASYGNPGAGEIRGGMKQLMR